MNGIYKWVVLGLICIISLGGIISLGNLLENNEAGEILVIQSPIDGTLTVYTEPGRKWQGWGTPTHYKRSNNFNFDTEASKLTIRFNDGGHASMLGTARYDLPLDKPHILDVHRTFGSSEALHSQLVKSIMEKSVYMAGPLMSSKESYAERKSDLINVIEDQAAKGVYQTKIVMKEVEDILDGKKKWVNSVDFKTDPKTGVILRQEESPLIRFGVTLYNVTPKEINYEPVIVEQIQQQQKATMAIQIAKANSAKAEQDAKTAEEQGKANSASAKWAQEVEKATAVTAAQKEKEVAETNAKQRLAVAEYDKQAAEQEKQKNILLGEGEAKRKSLVMAADGALTQKIEALKEINGAWADAIGSYKGALTPSIIMGSGGTGNGKDNSVVDLIEMLKANAARSLAADMSLPANTKP